MSRINKSKRVNIFFKYFLSRLLFNTRFGKRINSFIFILKGYSKNFLYVNSEEVRDIRYPIVEQTSISDCGASCLYMILKY